jgi:HAD superfamily hydrolase (TIGR01509 family)
MSKAVIFDLDGVLIDSKEIHFNSLNLALRDIDPKYIITKHEQETTYEGLTTRTKLGILSNTKGLPVSLHDTVWHSKQEYSSAMFESTSPDSDLFYTIKRLKDSGIRVGVASNSIRKTLDACLFSLGISSLVDVSLSNEDVDAPKPSPEIYQKAMELLGSDKGSTVIFEDSDIGLRAAIGSGAKVFAVKSRADVNIDSIEKAVSYLNRKIKPTVLIPMAGLGSRFADQGYQLPKPIIDVDGKPMIERVVESLGIAANYVFIVQQSHLSTYSLDKTLNRIAPGCKIVAIDGLTDGAARTTLAARDHIDNDAPLIIANSDQIIEWDADAFVNATCDQLASGAIALFTADHPKWSYAEIVDDRVARVAEKVVISNNASVGIYGWKSGHDYVRYAQQMIDKNIRTNNEFYICPVYNEAIEDGHKILPVFIDKMYGVGTPEDLNQYLEGKRNA